MKGKYQLGKRILTGLLMLAMVCSVVGVVPVSVKAEAKYPYAYTIRNFLSDYQYVAKGDLTLENHTVGGVVSGGNTILGSFGEAMVMPSYAKHVVSAGNLNVTKYEGVPSGYGNDTFYYQTMAADAIADYLQDYFVKGEFLDVEDAFSKLYQESAKMAQETEAVPSQDGDTLVVDFSKANSYKIDASLLTKNGNSTVNIIGVNSVDEFIDKEYSISFTGIGSDSLYLDYVWGSNTGTDYYVHILFNGNKFEQEMKKISTENYAGSQFVNSGMKFITNIPDASNVTTNGLSGHLVAPKADVVITGGGFEGGVIAGSVDADVEGHFYPYYKVGGPRDSEGNPDYEDIGGKIIISQRECSTLKNTLLYDLAVKPGTKAYLESVDPNDTIYYYIDTTGSSTALTKDELDQKTFVVYDSANPPELTAEKTVIYEKVVDDKDVNRYVYVNSEALVVKAALKIIETKVSRENVYVGDTIEIVQIKDKEGDYIIVSPENADFQWQVYDEGTGTWKNIEGETGYTLTTDESLEAKKVQCVVSGKNGYTGVVSDESIIRALPPIPTGCTDTTITISAEDGFEYKIVDKSGNVVQDWTEDGESGDGVNGSITFTGLTPSTKYDIIKRKVDTPETESREAEARTITQITKAELFPEVVVVGGTATLISVEDVNGDQVEINNENATYQWQVYDENSNEWKAVTGATGITFVPDKNIEGKRIRCEVTGINEYTGVVYAEGIVKTLPSTPTQPPVQIQTEVVSNTTLQMNSTSAPNEVNPPLVKKGSVELKIPTIVMKKVMGPKMKFKIKLLNQKGAKVRCESSNKKIATIDKKGLVKTKKKAGKCKLVINVSKGKHTIQYVVKLVVRKNCKKNYSLYKYKTKYKYPSVSLYKLVPKGKSYKIQLLHLEKNAKVTYKSNNKKVATVTKKGKVLPKKNGRADVTITVKQNGITYRYFVVVRVTQKGIESNTSYLKVIR